MGREEGGGFRMGNTGIPVVDSFRYLAKLIQYFKVKKKIYIYIFEIEEDKRILDPKKVVVKGVFFFLFF